MFFSNIDNICIRVALNEWQHISHLYFVSKVFHDANGKLNGLGL